LMMKGRTREACDVLFAARARFPDDADIERNLTQVAATCPEAKSNRRVR